MKTQYYTAASLDGYLATADDSLAWLDSLGDPEESSYPAFIAQVGALAMGSATYEWILRHSPPESPWPYSCPAWIFSKRVLPRTPSADLRFVQGDVRPVHAEMARAAAGRNIWIAGGGDLAGQFHDAGLLDEIIVQIGAATLGAGKPLFPRRLLGPALHLESVTRFGPRFAELRYTLSPPHSRGN